MLRYLKLDKKPRIIVKSTIIEKDKKFNYRRFIRESYKSYEAMRDISSHSRRSLYKSEARYRLLYGPEWKEISRNARIAAKYKCARCNKKFSMIDLHVHHKKPISMFIREGVSWIEEHECYGVKTRRPWHVEDNLIVLCEQCHLEEHGRTSWR